MTTREFYVQRQKAEYEAFVKVLKALAADRLDYKPCTVDIIRNSNTTAS